MELSCHSVCSSPRGVAGTTVEILEVGGWVCSIRVVVVMNKKEERRRRFVLCVVCVKLLQVYI